MTLEGFLSEIVSEYSNIHSSLPPIFQDFITLFILVILVVIYCIFVWKLRGFISSKNIFKFDLNQYNTSPHPAFSKILASMFYLLEYILIIPFIIFFWFAIFTSLLLLIVEASIPISTILFTSAIVVAAIRMTAYIPHYGEDISNDIAKMLPFTFLGIAILDPGVFAEITSRMITRVSNISMFFSGMINYLLFIVSLEVILRFFEFIFNIAGISEDEVEEEEPKK